MSIDVVVRTIVPIFLLIGMGFLSRKSGVLRPGDERVLNAYVYYFALPALFLVDLANTRFTEENLRFIFAGIIPIIMVVAVYLFLYFVFRFSTNTLYLLILSTVFGSLAFFGIPFLMFAFPTAQGESLATLSAASISIVGVTISITVLELYKLEKSTVLTGLKRVAKRLLKNPLIISIISGVVLSLAKVEIPTPIFASLHMLGTTTAPVAIFLLGVFLYGRKYTNKFRALELSLLRIVLLPSIAFLATMMLELASMERTVLVLMHSMPVAISLIVLSERYSFYKETIASLILISTLGAGLYLNLWLIFLGYG